MLRALLEILVLQELKEPLVERGLVGCRRLESPSIGELHVRFPLGRVHGPAYPCRSNPA